MSVIHSTIERISYSLKIHLIFHLPFLETQRMNFSAFHLPLYLIHQIMRMPNEIIYFSDHRCHDPFTPIFDHDHVSIAVDFSKPPVYDDLFDDEFETPKTAGALQPELMVMSSPYSLGVSFTSN